MLLLGSVFGFAVSRRLLRWETDGTERMKSLVANGSGLWLRWSSAYGPGTSGSRSLSGTRLPPAFKGLSHCSRTFHKYRGGTRTITRPIPPSSLENLPAVTTTSCKSTQPLTTCTPTTTPTATTTRTTGTRTRTRTGTTSTTTANTSTSFPALDRVSIGSAFSSSRLFSSSSSYFQSTLPAMATKQWTGVQVRKTFLDFFAERGHNVGMQTSLSPHDCSIDRYPSPPPACPVALPRKRK